MYNRQLTKSRILIIDDFSQFRLTLIGMLKLQGAVDIDQAANAVNAVNLCAKNRYDIIFCDYNLGAGQDGQQLLEELHERSLMSRGSLFMMVTAEMISAQVIGLLEYRPDAYLAKPFAYEQFRTRLDRLLARTEPLKVIYQALDNGLIDEAKALCDQVQQREPTTRFSCQRIKSEIFEQQQDFDAAQAIYEAIIKEQPLLWTMVGMGKFLFNTGRYQEALGHFQEMKVSFPNQVSVIDWIAYCLEKMDKIEESEKALDEAIKISPKSVTRQSHLGEIAESLGHYDTAQKAYSRTIQEGQHSCMVTAEHYQRYYDNSRKAVEDMSARQRSRVVADTELIAKKMERRFSNNPTALASNLCALATFFKSVDRKEKSTGFLGKLSKTLEHPECRVSEENFAFIEESLQSLSSSDGNEKSIAKITTRMKDFKQAIETEKKQDEIAREINQQGLFLLKQNQSQQAMDKFREAIDIMPENPNYLLNAAQMILLDDNMRDDSKLMTEARSWMQRINLKPRDQRRPLYMMLRGRLPNG